MINQNELIRNETNDIQQGAEYDGRHNLDIGWTTQSFHMHPHYEFYLFIQGKVQMIIEDESFDTHPMDLFIFPPGILHRALVLDSSVPYERAYFYITRKALSEISEDPFNPLQILDAAMRRGDYSYHADSGSGTRFIQLIDEMNSETDPSDPILHMINRCRISMLSLLSCKIIRQKDILAPRPPDRISEIIRYINDHIQEPLSLDSLSDRFYLSKYTLLHEFKSYTNISVHQYILSKRIQQAQLLMQQGNAPGSAAKLSGFNDYAGFYRAFVRSHNGLTPQNYYTRVRHGNLY